MAEMCGVCGREQWTPANPSGCFHESLSCARIALARAIKERDEARASRDEAVGLLRGLLDCVVNRGTVEGDLPWTSDVVSVVGNIRAFLAKHPEGT